MTVQTGGETRAAVPIIALPNDQRLDESTPPAPRPAVADAAERRFTQADLDKAIEDRLSREKRKSEEAATKARNDAEAAAAKEQGKYKELAEAQEGRVKELEPKVQRYEAALTKHLETQRKGLPAHITGLLDKLDPAEQLEWIATNADALKVAGTSASARPGTASNPPAAGTPGHDEKINQARTELAGSGRYIL